jgi:hypothetical protein
MSALVLAARVLLSRFLIVAAIGLLAACTNTGTVNWNVVQTTDAPAPSASPCEPLADAPGCVPAPSSSPSPFPSGPDGKDYVPYCLPSDPPGSYCQQAP